MEKSVKQAKYIPQADVIRVLAILGAVSIHLVYPIYSRPDFLGGSTWWLATVINAFSRVSIPLFIMLSGYLMVPKHQSIRQTLDRTLHRLVIPLFFWFGVFLWWEDNFLSRPNSIWDVLSMLFMSNMFNLYFLVILIGLYVFLPVLQTVRQSSRQLLWYLSGLSLVSGVFLYLAPYVLFRDVTLVNTFTIWFPFLGYFLLGHLLAKLPGKKLVWGSLFIASLVFTVAAAYFNVGWRAIGIDTFWRSSGVAYFDEYLSLNVIIMAVSLFQLLLHNQWISGFFSAGSLQTKVLRFSAKAAFPMYLIHGLVINWVDLRKGYAIEFLQGDLLTYFVTRTLLVISISFVLSSILVRIPYLNRVFGER